MNKRTQNKEEYQLDDFENLSKELLDMLFPICEAHRRKYKDEYAIAVRLRVKKKVQNLSAMWYKEFAKNFATQGDFGHESP